MRLDGAPGKEGCCYAACLLARRHGPLLLLGTPLFPSLLKLLISSGTRHCCCCTSPKVTHGSKLESMDPCSSVNDRIRHSIGEGVHRARHLGVFRCAAVLFGIGYTTATDSIRYNTITDADDKGFIVPGTSALLPCDGGSGYRNSHGCFYQVKWTHCDMLVLPRCRF